MDKLGLLGEKLGHSYSREIHEVFFNITGKDGSYEMIEKKNEELPAFLEELRNMKYKGINVTIPYKVEIMRYLDEVSEVAKKTGAVNTVTVRDGRLLGDNTDYFGFHKLLEINDIKVRDRKILLLGTGGAARAVYSLLSDEGAKNIYLATITENDSFKTRKTDRLIHYSEIRNIRNVDIIVNCTPVGMYPSINMCPLNEMNMIASETLIDVIYNPQETVLMKIYKQKGARTFNGLMMLVAQAIKAQEIWNGEEYDDGLLHKIYERLSEGLYK